MHEGETWTKRLYIHIEDLLDTSYEKSREKGSNQTSIYLAKWEKKIHGEESLATKLNEPKEDWERILVGGVFS